MSGWIEYATAFAVFFISHSLPVRPRVRARLVALMGPRGFTLAYSVLSVVALAWLIGAAGRLPFVPLWGWAPWQSTVTLVAMALVCAVLALTLGRPNPFSFGGADNESFEPRRPGIVRLTRHPLPLTMALWAFAHLLLNGDVAHVILFGALGPSHFLGHRIIDRRKRRAMGEAWSTILSEIANTSPVASIAGTPDIALRIAAALALCAGLLWGHPWLFGVNPLP